MGCGRRSIRYSKSPNHGQSANLMGAPPVTTHGSRFKHALSEIFLSSYGGRGCIFI
jgi:hypothetical protein